jgi:hypothetical protein
MSILNNSRFAAALANNDAPEPDVSLLAEEELHQKTLAAAVRAEEIRQEAQHRVKLRRAQADAVGAVWPAVDLGAIFDRGIQVPAPTVVAISDGGGLFYPGLPNVIFGDPSAGKTALVQHAAAEELREGRAVYVVDYETHAESWLTRLLALGLTRDQIVGKLHYLAVHEGLRPPTEFDSTARLVIIDSLSSVIDTTGGDSNSIEGVEAAYRQVVSPFTRAGLAAVIIDHVGNGDKSRPMGSIRKTGLVQGAMYKVAQDEGMKFGRGRTGSSTLTLFKDNPGGTGAAKGTPIARFVMESKGAGDVIHCRINPVTAHEVWMEAALEAADGVVKAKQRMTMALQEAGGAGLTKTGLRDVSRAEGPVFESAMVNLIAGGTIVKHRPKGARSERWFLDGIEVQEQF